MFDESRKIKVNDDLLLASSLNGDCHVARIDRNALDLALRAQGDDFLRRVTAQCPHLFADAAYFISAAQMMQMREVIAAVGRVVGLPGWKNSTADTLIKPPVPGGERRELGVFFGYDFHLNADGAHLIEINTNAGGAYLNALLVESQRNVSIPGDATGRDDLERVFLDMFRNEWRLARGDAPLQTIAIVDESPRSQYMYPEFVLASRVFERAGIAGLIADPAELQGGGDALYCRGRKVDLVYNRLTDFSLKQHPVLLSAYLDDRVVLTPNPEIYERFADKRNLELLTDAGSLREMGATEPDILVLQAGIPQTRVVRSEDGEQWWNERKQWFFKPATGYGSKGSYRGKNITHRVFGEIMLGNYVAQKLAMPGERNVCTQGGDAAVPLKADVRCYVYDGQVQLMAARLFQGQTTNFRTTGGGFAQIRVVG